MTEKRKEQAIFRYRNHELPNFHPKISELTVRLRNYVAVLKN